MPQLMIAAALNIPDPKFQLFQKVRRLKKKSVNCNCIPAEVGYITGMDYIDFRTALSEDRSAGWGYTINFIICATEEEALDLCENSMDVGESSLEKNFELLSDAVEVSK